MEAFARLFPFLATAIVGAAHAVAWRGTPQGAWLALGAAYGVLLLASLFLLRREELLEETFRLVPGDVSRGIGAAAFTLVLLVGASWVGVRMAPRLAFTELQTAIFTATAIASEWKRALAIVAFAAAEEIVFRGAVTAFLEERFGSVRAPWVASGMYVLATIPSLHPAMIGAAVLVSVTTAFVVSRWRRIVIAIVAHAVFSWLATEFVVAYFWQMLMKGR